MSLSEINRRYAKALYQIAQTPERRTHLDALLAEGAALLEKSPPFALFLEHPEVTSESKKEVLQKCIQDPLLVKFLLLLIARGKLPFLSQIAAHYHRLRLRETGVAEATLVTASPLEPEAKTALQSRLEHIFRHPFILNTQIDEQMIGGAVLFIGNRLLDYSFKGRLTALKHALLRENGSS